MRTTQSNRKPCKGQWAVLLLALSLVLPGCSSSTLWDLDKDLINRQRDAIDFQVTTVGGVHFLFGSLALFGDGTLRNGLKHFQEAALENNAQGIRIVETDTTVYWWVLPPLTFLFPVVVTRVTGDLEYSQGAAPPVNAKVL